MVRVIEAMYRSPKFAVKEMGKRSTQRRQYSGIRQGCPLSPYLFVIVMTVIMRDIDKQLTQEERHAINEERPIGANGHDRLLYADDTLILASNRSGGDTITQNTSIIIQVQYETQSRKMRTPRNELPREHTVYRWRSYASGR